MAPKKPTLNQGNSQQRSSHPLFYTVTLYMDEKALIKRRTQLERQRDAQLRACRAKWQSRINSVDRLLRAAAIAGGATSQTKPGKASSIALPAKSAEERVNGDRKKAVMEVVQQTLQHNQGFFTARVLVELINRTRPGSVTVRDIGHLLWRLRMLGEIRLVEKGCGRKPPCI
jgi:hypothetical protein